MFNSNVVKILSQLNYIGNSVILKYPKTVIFSENFTVGAVIDLSELDSDGFNEIPLNDSLNDFLSTLKLFDDNFNLTQNGDVIKISDSKRSVDFLTFEKSLLNERYDSDDSQFVRTEETPTVCSFDFNSDKIKELKSVSSIFKNLESIIFDSDGENVQIVLGNLSNFNARSNSFSLKPDAEVKKRFKVAIPVSFLNQIPISDYLLEIKYNSSRDAYRIFLTNKYIKSFKIIVQLVTE